MTATQFNDLFSREILETLFPEDRSDRFFDALFGDAGEGAYDIALAFKGETPNELRFEFQLKRRPRKCLACNLTYGLPRVFDRHPVIDVKGLVAKIDRIIDGRAECAGWRLGATNEISPDLHAIPLTIEIDSSSGKS